MFTGIVSDIGAIVAVEDRGDLRVEIATAYDTAGIDLGASIACSGVCLTVVDKGPGRFAVDVSHETVNRTAAEQWTAGRRLNLERALRMGDELGGHIVTGHVDGIGVVKDVRDIGGSTAITISVHPDTAPFMATKGSVTIDGVSLTVNDVADLEHGTEIALNIIPHTQSVTTLGDLTIGRVVNIEIDVLARYLQRMEAYRGKTR
ncbi:riboflavin synthase [Sphingomonas sp. RS2018]